MAVHFHPLKVERVESDTQDSVIVSFEVPEALRPVFQFTQGQNITLRAVIAGESIRRSYSICTAPFDGPLSVAIKKAGGGAFSTYANEILAKGDVIEVLPPTGSFYTKLDAAQKKCYLAIAVGSGITPIISLIKTTLAVEKLSDFTLVYGNRTRSSIMFLEQLEGLKNKYPARFNLVHVISREQTDAPLNHGRIDTSKLDELSRVVKYEQFDETFICGPQELVFLTKEYLEKKGLQPGKIHFELFTTPGQTTAPQSMKQEQNLTKAGDTSQVTIKLDGHSFQFDLPLIGDSILDGALKLGADLPFACKGGVCSTCRAKLLEGEVKMDSNYALEDEEVRNGFILTCQSHPLTKQVTLDFDTR
ncbi:MAG: 1,2-phenylacetyl-CoA epoxidase subunit PaaE [Bacteroidota bacterium]